MRISIAVLLSLSIACLSAQDTRANISGTVTDPQGASIARAGVIVTNTNTTNATKLTTNDRGYYEVPLLLPGTYAVVVESAGFKKALRTGIISQTSSLNRMYQVQARIQF